MEVKLKTGEVKSFQADLTAVGLFEEEKTNQFLDQVGKEIMTELGQSIQSKEFSADFGEMKSFTPLGKLPTKKVLIVGLGKKKDFTIEKLRRISANVHKAAKSLGVKNYVTVLHRFGDLPYEKRVYAVAEAVILADYDFTEYKTVDKDKIKKLDHVFLLETRPVSPPLENLIKKAVVICSTTNYIRDLVNRPANEVNPEYLANEAEKLKKLMRVKVMDAKEMKQKGFGGILAVGSGSANEPKLITLEYNPNARKSIAIVGKGVTFDSGGLSLKPSRYMETMKQDMAGAAVVLAVCKIAAELKLNVHIIGVIPTVENMPGPKSYRPDDIVTFFNGKTAEINNTDAEGRVILADGLAYAETFKPQRIIDLATLTGACVVALGYWATGLMTKDDILAKDLTQAGEETGDRVWRLPLWEEYFENMKSDIADVRNCGRGHDAGTIEGAVFLSHFVKNTPWAHLDIAGTAFWNEAKFYNPKGATGAGVRLLVKYLEGL